MYSCMQESILNARAQQKLVNDKNRLLAVVQEFLECGANAGNNQALITQAQESVKLAKGE